jgi:hypothetical protein
VSYPNWRAERPFAVPSEYREVAESLDREQLLDALYREAELRGKWEHKAGVPALHRPPDLCSCGCGEERVYPVGLSRAEIEMLRSLLAKAEHSLS